MDLVGSVEDSDVIIVDDMIDTAGTLCKAASVLKDFGGVVSLCRAGVRVIFHAYGAGFILKGRAAPERKRGSRRATRSFTYRCRG